MKKRVTLIDYGIGNLFSVRRAFEVSGAEVSLTAKPEEILASDRLILPGVGAFADGMRELGTRGLVEPILEFVKTGKPFAGICLGMQMLFDESEEFGTHAGLGVIPGKVQRIPDRTAAGESMKVPHVAWDPLLVPSSISSWNGTALSEISPGDAVYLVHSFAAMPAQESARLAEVDYGGHRVVAAVQRGCVMGFQFHPERSGPVGLKIVRRFLEV